VTATPCKGRVRRRDVLRTQNAQVFYAKILRCAAGRYAGCMALAVVNFLVQLILTIGMGCEQRKCRNCGGWFRF